MGKSALGKGLGQLMAGQQSPARKPSSPPESLPSAPAGKVTPVDFGRGLSTLVAAGQSEKPAERLQARFLLPTWFFFVADVLLLAFTVAVCLDADAPMRTGEILFAVTSVALGTLLAIMGVLRDLPAE